MEMKGPNEQFYKFLQDIRLEKFYEKFEENECNDIRDIQYLLDDEEFLKIDIGMKKIECRRFLGEIQKLKNDMDSFISSDMIPSILLKRLATSGIVTMDMLSSMLSSLIAYDSYSLCGMEIKLYDS